MLSKIKIGIDLRVKLPNTSKSSLRITVVDGSMSGSWAYSVRFRAALMNSLTSYCAFKIIFTILLKKLKENSLF